MSPRRLLLVIDEMEVGGSQRQVTELLGGLDRLRWQPELLFFRNPSFLVGRIERMGVIVHHLPKRRRIDPIFVLRLATLLRRGRYELVHAFSLTAELWTSVASMLVPNPPQLVSSVRGLYLAKPAWFWQLKRFIVHRSTAVIANAHACAATASARVGIAASHFDVVANGVMAPEPMGSSERELLRRAIGCPDDRVFGLFVGRLVPLKNLKCLIHALARMPGAKRPWIAVVGDGPLRAEIETMVVARDLALHVRFLGERADAAWLMQAADFLVLPSVQEGMSNALLEAMAAGCPVIASAVGGNGELVEEGVSGFLFPSDDDLALSRCLQRMCGDAQLRRRLAEQARLRAIARHTIERMVSATSAIYDRCLLPSAERSRLHPQARPSIRDGR